MVNVIKENEWICKSCRFPNKGTLTCSHCGEPVSDESVFKLAKNLAEVQMLQEALDNANPQGNSVPMQQSVSQSWNCPSCGAQNSGKFCESCGAKRS